jgi:hypothetical protein
MGFADPLALAFSGLIGVLVLLYLWERTRQAIVVPSLLLWQTLREDVVRSRRFRPDLLFFLQLLLLLALIAGLAKPYLRGGGLGETGARYIVLLDTSASMQAAEGRSSRFELARGRALEFVGDLVTLDEVMLVEAGKQPRVAVNFTRDHAEVETALRHAAPSDAAGDLSLAVEFAEAFRQRSDVPAQLAVFSDLPREQLPAAVRDSARVFQFGETDDNVGIQSVQVFQGRFQDYRSARAYVGIENFSHRVKHGVLSVSLDDRVIDRRGFTLPARESAGFLIQKFPGPGQLTASLDGQDALTSDDVAFGWIRPASKPRILLVSAPGPLVQDFHRVAASNGMTVTDADPKQFDARMVDGFDLTVFHQFVPLAPARGNVLYIYPPDSPAFHVFGEAENVEILDWDASHPALEAVQLLSVLPLRRTRIITSPPWSTTLLSARTAHGECALAFAGEREGYRAALVAFDLGGERLLANDNLDLFLFFMNLVGWLLPNDARASVAHTGDVWAWDTPPASALLVRDPRGGEMRLPAGVGTIELPLAGPYTISADGEQRLVFANFFEPSESDIGRAARRASDEPGPPPARFHTQDSPATRRPLGKWLYVVALALLLSEWVIARRLR